MMPYQDPGESDEDYEARLRLVEEIKAQRADLQNDQSDYGKNLMSIGVELLRMEGKC